MFTDRTFRLYPSAACPLEILVAAFVGLSMPVQLLTVSTAQVDMLWCRGKCEQAKLTSATLSWDCDCVKTNVPVCKLLQSVLLRLLSSLWPPLRAYRCLNNCLYSFNGVSWYALMVWKARKSALSAQHHWTVSSDCDCTTNRCRF